jgi:hypothetical protein
MYLERDQKWLHQERPSAVVITLPLIAADDNVLARDIGMSENAGSSWQL